MKNIVKYLWPILIMPILYIPYLAINQEILVKWLGCSTTELGKNGEIMINNFNANDFTSFFWFIIAASVIILTAYITRNLKNMYTRIIFISLTVVIALFMANSFCMSMLWK